MPSSEHTLLSSLGILGSSKVLRDLSNCTEYGVPLLPWKLIFFEHVALVSFYHSASSSGLDTAPRTLFRNIVFLLGRQATALQIGSCNGCLGKRTRCFSVGTAHTSLFVHSPQLAALRTGFKYGRSLTSRSCSGNFEGLD